MGCTNSKSGQLALFRNAVTINRIERLLAHIRQSVEDKRQPGADYVKLQLAWLCRLLGEQDIFTVQATNKGREAKLLHRRLAAVYSSIHTLCDELPQAQQALPEVTQLRQQVQHLESVAIKCRGDAKKKGTEACGNIWSGPETDSSSNSSSSSSNSKLQSETVADDWLALLPSLTIAQLSDHMSSSQPAAVKAAAARELARRLRKLNTRHEVAAFEAHPHGVSRLVQLLSEPDDDDTQLAALEALSELWCARGASEFALQLVQQPGLVDTLVRLLHEGGAAKQAAAARAVWCLFPVHSTALSKSWPEPLAPAQSDTNSWPVVSGLVAVLQAPAVSVEGKCDAAWAMYELVRASMGATACHAASQLHPAVQAAIKPLEALQQHECQHVRDAAAEALGTIQ